MHVGPEIGREHLRAPQSLALILMLGFSPRNQNSQGFRPLGSAGPRPTPIAEPALEPRNGDRRKGDLPTRFVSFLACMSRCSRYQFGGAVAGGGWQCSPHLVT